MISKDARSLVVLAAACAHEFAWQGVPAALQGDVRSALLWPLIASFCWWGCAPGAVTSLQMAVALAVGIMSASTSMCSALWLIHPFERLAGEEQCSRWLGKKLLFVSACVAVFALGRWRKDE